MKLLEKLHHPEKYFVISGNWGPYSSRLIRFSKARLVAKEQK